MLRHLPEGSLYRARREAELEVHMKELQDRRKAGEDVELPDEDDLPLIDRLTREKQAWTLLPSLIAEGMNRDRALIWAQFDKEHRPELPTMGPEAWWSESQKNTHEKSADGERRQPSLLERHFGKLAAHG